MVSSMLAQMSRTRISKDDFTEASEYLNAMRGRQAVVVKRALLFAAIVAYARPFTENEDKLGRATTFLKASLSRILNQSEQAQHDKLLSLRDEALAHSQFDRKPIVRVRGSSSGFLMKGRPFDILAEPINLELFGSLCSKMERHCVNQLFDLNRKLDALKSKS